MVDGEKSEGCGLFVWRGDLLFSMNVLTPDSHLIIIIYSDPDRIGEG